MNNSVNFDRYQGLARALFEESGHAHILFDPETSQILDVNAATQRLCGIGLRDLLGTQISNLFRSNRSYEFGVSEFRSRTTHLPYSAFGCQLKTFRSATRVPVDVTVTRLIVKPQPLMLLTLCEVNAAFGNCPESDLQDSGFSLGGCESNSVSDDTPVPASVPLAKR